MTTIDFNQLSEMDIELKLLNGSSFFVGDIPITPYSVGEIIELGYTKYMQTLNSLCMTREDFLENLSEDKRNTGSEYLDKLVEFDFYLKLGGPNLVEILKHSLSIVFRTEDILIEDNMVVLNSDSKSPFTIDRNNFSSIVKVIKLQNYLTAKKKETEANPADAATAALIEKMRKNKEKVAKKKASQNGEQSQGQVDFPAIVSAVSTKSFSVNKFNFKELTVYQIYDEYQRLNAIDNYTTSIQALLAGAKDVKPVHWASKQNKEDFS